jgi:hypothetical protein
MTRGKGKNEEDECIDQVQSEVQRGRVPTYIGGVSPINDRDVYVRKWEVISNRIPPARGSRGLARCDALAVNNWVGGCCCRWGWYRASFFWPFRKL